MNIKHIRTALADAQIVMLQGVAGPEMVIVGGELRVERHAAQILAACLRGPIHGNELTKRVAFAIDAAEELCRQLDARSAHAGEINGHRSRFDAG